MNFKRHWQLSVALLSIAAIITHFFLQVGDLPYANGPLLIALTIGGIPLLLQILVKFIKGDLGADLLAGLALITGVFLQEYLASIIIILMLASGQSLERYAMRKASSVLLALAERMPSIAHRKVDNHIENIHFDTIGLNDEIVIYPHETCPVDGVVVEGHGSMDESYLTGEPYQISKAPGAFVMSGAINGESLLVIKSTRLATDSRYASIVKVLEEAVQKRPAIRRLGDQIAMVFAPVALLFAILAWYFTGDSLRFLAVLVIATPCPLLIAIPITIISAISKAAKKSIIIKDPTVLEQLPICKTAIFDKTGTLTYGKPILNEVRVVSPYTREQAIQYTASLERYSKHPLASAVLKAAEKDGIVLLESSNISETPGQGLWGMIDNHSVHVTGRKKLLINHPEFRSIIPDEKSGLECMVLIDNHYAATLYFQDEARPESQPFISHLKPSHQFNKVMLVSGDRKSEVDYLGKLLHISDIYALQTPEQKLAIVREEVKTAPTVFMGDGINDAPALTAATVGIAFGQNSNVTSEAAGVVIMENTLNKVDELFHLCLTTRKVVLQSALGGMLLSIIGMCFAAFGYISPVSGAIIQEIIDVLAIINALRLTWGSDIKIDLFTFGQSNKWNP
ncbi:heavy metal translocating P-type ATPase [Legionella waltersii]|uniref:P-type Zn(2+) transporter n=1 Tax=Legionella waltersii TaxID=66969 RepID=A0A0W1A0R1_9GAMM|nr:heavy metal translocating P-type ATPase [Legionella waltersii]KTD74965.1 cation transport ATPase [Legionella waltersii]SNV08437.1 cation transport ATPase [Legionella waltersii]